MTGTGPVAGALEAAVPGAVTGPVAGAVLITGASRGIGRALAHRLALDGTPAVLWARDGGQLDDVVRNFADHGVPALGCAVDVGDPAAVRAAGHRLREHGFGLRAVVLNAGVGQWHPLLDHPHEVWTRTLATNLQGAFSAVVELLPLLLAHGDGQLIGIGSDSGLTGLPDRAAYCASKWGLRGVLEVARAEHRDQGLRVTHVALGAVDTGFRTGVPGGRPGALSAQAAADLVAWLLALPAGTEVREIHAASTARPFGAAAATEKE
ncbi:SDR family oxidoreductase [Kitasatospora nipponensis]|uniref:SDR family oxidoreductase n=1 Tax=Kitasatospora nipponensis TaxID=258049 RepID=A0ABP4GIL0_9ACTN